MSPETPPPSFRQFAETLPQIVWTAGPDGTLDFASGQLHDLAGLPQGTAPDAHARGELAAMIHPDERRRCLDLWHYSVRTGRRFSFECRCRFQETGLWRWHLLQALPERDAAGLIIRWYGTASDIHEQRLSARQQQETGGRLASVLTLSGAGTFRWDIRTGKVEWDAPIHRLFGVPAGDGPLTFTQFIQLVHPEDRVTVSRRCGQCASTGGDFDMEFRVVHPDGSVHLLHALGQTFLDSLGRPDCLAGACIDLTEPRRRADQQADAQKRLQQEIGTLRRTAEKTSRERDAFLAALSHELRSPLSPVLLLAGEAAANAALPAPVRSDFKSILDNLELSTRLIDDLQDLASISRGRLRLDQRRLDFHAVLQEALSALQPELDRRQLRLVQDLNPAPLSLYGDASRLRQVLRTVLENILSSVTAAGGTVFVQTRLLPDERKLTVIISDSPETAGGGEVESLFDALPLSVLSAKDGEENPEPGSPQPGSQRGLGLAVASMLAELHGGSVRTSSKVTAFLIKLPVLHEAGASPETPPADAAPPAAAQAPAPGFRFSFPPVASPGAAAKTPVPPERRRVLLIEDHEPTRTALERLLQRRRCTVASTGTVAEARALAATHEFDFVISDIGLPDGNGNDLMKELRERYHLRGIAMTGYGMEHDIQRSRAAGFLYHLTKPVSIQSLDSALAGINAQSDASKTKEA